MWKSKYLTPGEGHEKSEGSRVVKETNKEKTGNLNYIRNISQLFNTVMVPKRDFRIFYLWKIEPTKFFVAQG